MAKAVGNLQIKIDKRIAEANKKDIRGKVEQVARRFGTHTIPSYRDSGETSHEHNWELARGKIKLNCHVSYFGHCTLVVNWGKKQVFEAYSDSVKDERVVRSYIPGKDWEKALDDLNKPFAAEAKRQQRELKKKFGL